MPIKTDPFAFNWLVDEQGYEWVQGLDSEPRLVACWRSEGPESRLRIYAPLKEQRLFLKFAAVKPQRADIQHFANRYGTLFNYYSDGTAVQRAPGAYRTAQLHGTSLRKWKWEIGYMRALVDIWKATKAARKNVLKGVISWDRKDMVSYKIELPLGMSSQTILAAHSVNQYLLTRFRSGDVLKPARYLLQAEINKRIADINSSNHLAIVPRLVWCPGPRIDGFTKPDHHQRIIFEPTNLLAAMWLQFARAVTEEYQLQMCEGCGEYFQVGKGARRMHTKTCSSRCRQRASRIRRQASQESRR